MIVKPHRFFNLVNFVKKIGLVEKGILKFASSQMNSIKKRRRVYYAWVVFAELNFSMKEIGEIINANNMELHLYLGKHDKIITEKGMKNLLQYVADSKVYITDSGHNKLIEKAAKHIKEKNDFQRNP